ncbi:MAG: SemiSWEET family transporter [Bacteroidota bacterium]
MNLTSVIGVAASIFTATSLIPQLIKLVKEKDSGNISLGMLAVLFIGLVLWVWYGFLKEDWILIISNAFSLLINIITGILSIKYKPK